MDEKTNKGGYDVGDMVFITYTPPLFKFEKLIDWSNETDIAQSEKAIFNTLKKVVHGVRENHYIIRMECGKGGNFHLHIIYYIKNIREYNLWMCYVRQKFTRHSEHSLDFRKVTHLEGVNEYVNKNHLYPSEKLPMIDNLIDKALGGLTAKDKKSKNLIKKTNRN